MALGQNVWLIMVSMSVIFRGAMMKGNKVMK